MGDLPSHAVIALVKEDALADASALDGQPFTGNINLGNIYASILALCDVVDEVLHRLNDLEDAEHG